MLIYVKMSKFILIVDVIQIVELPTHCRSLFKF